jgi:hypothetical protein
VQCLDFGGCRLGSAGLATLAAELGGNRSLLHLNLRATGIGGYRDLGEYKPDATGVQALAVALRQNRHLLSLDLSDNQLGGFWTRDGCLQEDLRGMEALAEGLQGCSNGGGSMLQTLNLSKCHIQTGGAAILARVFRRTHVRLKCVLLDRNNIGGYTNYCGHSQDPNTAAIVSDLAAAISQNRYLRCCSFVANNLSKELQDRLTKAVSTARRSKAAVSQSGGAIWPCPWCSCG